MTEKQTIPRFRAWNKTREEMGNVKRMRFDDDGNVTTVLFKGKTLGTNLKIDEIELMQSTGLKDKNGKEIFEGDLITGRGGFNSIVRYGKWNYVEDYSLEYIGVGFYLDNFSNGTHRFSRLDYEYISKNFNVVGNIYENPDRIGFEENNEI